MISSASLSIFRHLFSSVAEEMGVTLERAAYSPNIKERLDFSCALFLGNGRMLAQAAHMPVHLGAMPASVQAAIQNCAPFAPGDVVIVNDPYQGGNHLPDITLVSPVFSDQLANQQVSSQQVSESTSQQLSSQQKPPQLPNYPITQLPNTPIPNPQSPIPNRQLPLFFVASRAHHADVGGMAPGSMPLSTELFQEGIIIPPIKLIDGGKRNEAVWQLILRNVRTPEERKGDLAAQLAAHVIGEQRLHEIVARYGLDETVEHADALIDYAKQLTKTAVSQMPNGRFHFTDYLDNDGQSDEPLPISVTLTVEEDSVTVDFSGTAPAVKGNLNAVPAIAESAVAYCIRCAALQMLKVDLPMNHGAFEPIKLIIEKGSLLDPHPPHAVAAGNVETSQRIVDAVFGAMAQALPELIPAASQGTMNNLAFGGVKKLNTKAQRNEGGERKEGMEQGEPFAYYETIGGGVGAGPEAHGGDGMHVHMSNTLNTPIEALEFIFPLRVVQYGLREGSGGNGRFQGGEGLVREIEFLNDVQVTVTSERRERGAYGLQGGDDGKPGQNSLARNDETTPLPGKFTQQLQAGDRLRIESPGGGGWGNS